MHQAWFGTDVFCFTDYLVLEFFLTGILYVFSARSIIRLYISARSRSSSNCLSNSLILASSSRVLVGFDIGCFAKVTGFTDSNLIAFSLVSVYPKTFIQW